MLKLLAICLIAGSVQAAFYEESASRWVNHINNIETTWKAGHNPYFSGKSLEDVQRLMGAKQGEEGFKGLSKKKQDRGYVYLPRGFVAGKDKWPKCDSTISFIKDQSDCGSCWAMAASSVVASRVCIANEGSIRQDPQFLNEKKPAVDMSSEDLLACCDSCGYGCEGGYPGQAMAYWRDQGVVTGGWYGSKCGCEPYEIPPGEQGHHSTPSCTRRCRPGYGKSFSQDKHRAVESYRLPADAQSIMQDIYDNGPVECGFTVYENFMHYKNGVYSSHSGSLLGHHAINVIGWGEEAGTPYWLINNSWNTTWGDNGQVKLLRGKNFMEIEEGCVAGKAKPGDHDVNLKC